MKTKLPAALRSAWYDTLLFSSCLVCLLTGTLAGDDALPAIDSQPTVFHEGSLLTPPEVEQNEESRNVREAARLISGASQDFDRGDEDDGRKKAMAAVRILEKLERTAIDRGNGRGKSQLALQRGRIRRDFLGDRIGAKEAFLDAIEGDGENREAQDALLEVLDAEERESAQANRKSDSE